jgi:hypothetical protein
MREVIEKAPDPLGGADVFVHDEPDFQRERHTVG